MSHFADRKANREALQQALRTAKKLGGSPYYSGKIDGDLGPLSADAIRDYRRDHDITPQGAVIDAALLRSLHLGPDLITETGTLPNFVLTIILNQALKGLGINMDFAKISKAIAGAISGAGLGGGASAWTYISLPPEALSALPPWVGVVVPAVNTVIGAVIGFSVVYFAPANKPV